MTRETFRVPGFGCRVNATLGARHSKPLYEGQSTLEYAVFTGVVAAALVAMNVYVRRAIQANLKQVEDHINAEAIR